jgi:hypothetical protein
MFPEGIMDNASNFFYLALGPEEIDQLTGSADRIADEEVEKFLDGAVRVILTDLQAEGISVEVGEPDQRDCPDDWVLRKIIVQRNDDLQKANGAIAVSIRT